MGTEGPLTCWKKRVTWSNSQRVSSVPHLRFGLFSWRNISDFACL